MCNLILFGASGDICRKKVYPALYEIFIENKLNKIIGYGRSKFTKQMFQDKINYENTDFLSLFDYQIGQYTDYKDFLNLKNKITDCGIKKGDIILIYFGVPSSIFKIIIKNLCLAHIDMEYNCRYLLEKPIGNNLESSNEILNFINNMVDFKKIFVIDHYLGKQMLDKIKNTEKKNIQKIIINLNETENVEHRIEYFDDVGLFKDMIQSHVFSILFYCFENMFNINNLEQDLNIINFERGQYKGYSGKNKVATYINLELKWNDINIIISTGKGMLENKKEIQLIDDNGINIFNINNSHSEYKCLIENAFIGNQNRFLNKDKIENFWKLTDYILKDLDMNNLDYYSIPK